MNVAILGANSQIAKDLIISFAKNTDYHCVLFVRNREGFWNSLSGVLIGRKYQVLEYSSYDPDANFDVILNFVGVGDPARAARIGGQIFEITEQYDKLALDYIRRNPACKYIFMSSGAVYGGNFEKPATQESLAQVSINSLERASWYSMAKLYAEAKHRAMPEFQIVDVRVFNYFSHAQDIEARFFITDLVRAVGRGEVFKTSMKNIYRDFITPRDFFSLINKIIESDRPINCAVDCYTKSPVDKFSLLEVLSKKFSLVYELQEDFESINATGEKSNYYSLNKIASELGYEPEFTSLEGVVYEIERISGIR